MCQAFYSLFKGRNLLYWIRLVWTNFHLHVFHIMILVPSIIQYPIWYKSTKQFLRGVAHNSLLSAYSAKNKSLENLLKNVTYTTWLNIFIYLICTKSVCQVEINLYTYFSLTLCNNCGHLGCYEPIWSSLPLDLPH